MSGGEGYIDFRIGKFLLIFKQYVYVIFTGAWSGIDTLMNCNKIERDKIWKYHEKLIPERKRIQNLLTSVGVTW